MRCIPAFLAQVEVALGEPAERGSVAPIQCHEAARLARGGADDASTLDGRDFDLPQAEEVGGAGADHPTAADHHAHRHDSIAKCSYNKTYIHWPEPTYDVLASALSDVCSIAGRLGSVMENSFAARRAVRDAPDCPATCGMIAPTGPSRDRRAPRPPVTEIPRYTAAERRADAAIHCIGLALGLVGCAALGLTIWNRALDIREVTALGLYGIGLMTMLACSALYNLTEDGPRKRLYRRLDHAAIFLMIAGTYTPFALVALGGAWGVALLAVVWGAALVGIAVELLDLRRHDRLSVAAYLLLGWIIVPALVLCPP